MKIYCHHAVQGAKAIPHNIEIDYIKFYTRSNLNKAWKCHFLNLILQNKMWNHFHESHLTLVLTMWKSHCHQTFIILNDIPHSIEIEYINLHYEEIEFGIEISIFVPNGVQSDDEFFHQFYNVLVITMWKIDCHQTMK